MSRTLEDRVLEQIAAEQSQEFFIEWKLEWGSWGWREALRRLYNEMTPSDRLQRVSWAIDEMLSSGYVG